MDIAGYDSWRLAGPDYGHEVQLDDDDLREASLELAEDMVDNGDYSEVDHILSYDETWQDAAFDCAVGRIDQAAFKTVILNVVSQYLIDEQEDDVIEHATVTMRDRDEH